MNFGQALEMCKAGRRIAREGWNGKKMWVYLERGRIDERNLPKFANNIGGVSVDLFEWCGRGEPTRNPCFVMVTPVGIEVPGWLASQTDMIAEDWTVLDEPVPFRDDAAGL